jgi:rhodanese-related sulfurtransferase
MHLTRSWFRPIAAAALAIAAITGVSACSSSQPATSPAASGSTSAATIQHLAAGDFAAALKETGTIVLDVRTPAEFASGHLPEARNIDIEGSGFATGIATLDKNATYAVYCRSGNRSDTAMGQMAAAGFTRLYDLTGGIGAWQGISGPIVVGG